jgi:hypothetical protein
VRETFSTSLPNLYLSGLPFIYIFPPCIPVAQNLPTISSPSARLRPNLKE